MKTLLSDLLDLSRPVVMGVLNSTPDSFSDGGRFLNLDAALKHAEKMHREGAKIIDVGGESTRPGAEPVTEIEELERVVPIVEGIAKRFDLVVSLDSSTPAVMREAVGVGAKLINDVRALTRPGALQQAAELDVPVCIMHMQGKPQTMQARPIYHDVVNEVLGFLRQRVAELNAAGIANEQILIDPGFGFGKSLQHNLQLLKHLTRFKVLTLPILVGISRKSMLGAITGRAVDERLPASLAAATLAVFQGANIVRAHDVAETVDAIKIAVEVSGVD